MQLQPSQQRVVDEKAELDYRLSKLNTFIQSSPIYAGLPADEKDRQTRQAGIMASYSEVLGERIAAFKA